MAERISDIVLLLDKDLCLTYISPSFQVLTGRNPEDLLGRPLPFGSLPPADQEKIRKAILDNRALRATGPVEIALSSPGGSTIVLEFHGVPIQEGGVFCGIQLVAHDITSLRRVQDELRIACGQLAAAEEELRGQYDELARSERNLAKSLHELHVSEKRYRTYIDNSPEGIFILGPAGETMDANPAACSLLGYPRDELLALPLSALSFEKTQTDASFRELQENGALRAEAVLRTKSGDPLPVLLNAVRLADGQCMAFCTDITDRRQMEEALRKRTAFFEAQVESTIDGILVVNEKNERILVNRRLVSLWNIPEDILSDPDDGPLLRYVVGRTKDPVSFYEKVLYLYRHPDETSRDIVEFKDGTVYDRYSAPVIGNAGRYLGRIWTFRDITGQKLAGEAVTHANRKLALLSGITRHDISNQLTVLQAYRKLLEKRTVDPDSRDYIARIDGSARRISAMIQFTREYENVGALAPAWQDCRTLAGAAANDTLPETIRFHNDLPGGMEIFADPMIIRVFSNLMDNAIRYGGKVRSIRLRTGGDGDAGVIVCEDDGDGIPEGEKELIFGCGYGKNTGLGLFLAREILGITGITIRETGEPGKGARFEIHVPEEKWRSVPGSVDRG
jgi:PAS domain S-box-containing protein